MQAHRLPGNPLITPDMLPGEDGANINGPSLIRVPEWLENPLGRYYLYFAHHQGRYIRLAWADDLAGPWRVHEPGTLQLEQTPFDGHIASPDVHLDHANRRLVMYYHGCSNRADPASPWRQPTCIATSGDGLSFTSGDTLIAESYLRVFRHGGWYYGIAKGGELYRSRDGFTGWEQRQVTMDHSGRHWATLVRPGVLHLFYSRWGDMPEHILHAPVRLDEDWNCWRIVERAPLLRPEHPWEGADRPHAVSLPGAVHEPVNHLRDPAVFEEGGRVYLFYSIAGEQGIAMAELTGLDQEN